MRMDVRTYRAICNNLQDIDDVKEVAEKYSLPMGTVHSILNQKVVTKVKKRFSRIKDNSPRHFRQWQKGKSIKDIAKRNGIPATLMVSMLLREMGIPKKGFIKNIDEHPEGRLKNEVKEALLSDYFFSPRAHDMHADKGELGETILAEWLEKKGISYKSEYDLRNEGFAKTPDFLLNEELDVDGVSICWIESKALFGDEKEHDHYIKKQFRDYEENYGTGMIVYWYGFIDTICFNGNMIKDYRFFDNGMEMIDDLLHFDNNW